MSPLNRSTSARLQDVPAWAATSFLIILAYLPYAEALHDQLHYQLFGFAAEVTVVPTFAIFLIFLLIGIFRKPNFFIYILIFLSLVAVVLVARYFWALDLTVNDTYRQAVGLRYIIFVPVYLVVAGYILQEARSRKLASTIIIINAGIAATVGVLYVAGLILYRVVPEGSEVEAIYGVGEVGRAAGLSAGVNVYSSFLLLALVVAFLVYDRSTVIRVAAIAVIVLGILSSQSRWPLMSSVLVLGCTMLLHERAQNKKRLLVLVFGVVFALSVAYFMTESTGSLVGGVRGRISQSMGEDIGVRRSKYEIGLNAIFENSYTMLAGATPENLIQGYKQEYIFSDSGILSMFITAGVPITLIFIFFCYRYGRAFAQKRQSMAIYVFAVVALGVISFNNAIYWDSWLFHAAVVCFLITGRQGEED